MRALAGAKQRGRRSLLLGAGLPGDGGGLTNGQRQWDPLSAPLRDAHQGSAGVRGGPRRGEEPEMSPEGAILPL